MLLDASTLAQYREHLLTIFARLQQTLRQPESATAVTHYNPLQPYQHLNFFEALHNAAHLPHLSTYLPELHYRQFYQQGRITEQALNRAMADSPTLNAASIIWQTPQRTLTRGDIYRVALRVDIAPFKNQNAGYPHHTALTKIQADVPALARQQLLATGQSEREIVQQLWQQLLDKLALPTATLPSETLFESSPNHLEDWFQQQLARPTTASGHLHTQALAQQQLDKLLGQVGSQLSLRGLVLHLSNIDSLPEVQSQLLRFCTAYITKNLAKWPLPNADSLGLFGAWRASLAYDVGLFLHQLPDWQQIIAHLPEHALDTLSYQLTALNLPSSQWDDYLTRLALEIPDWSTLIAHSTESPDVLIDYLAIRLTLDHLWLNQVCHDLWKVDASLSALRGYFLKNLSEFLVRWHLYQRTLPECLTQLAEHLLIRAGSERHCRAEWQQLADMIVAWQASETELSSNTTAGDCGWRLFRLCQHLGLASDQLTTLTNSALHAMIQVLNDFDHPQRNHLWLTAYEYQFRDELFTQLQRSTTPLTQARPEVHMIFCTDVREEPLRRHLEHHMPSLTTLSCTGNFGLPYTALTQADSAAPAHYAAPPPRAHSSVLTHALIAVMTDFSLLKLPLRNVSPATTTALTRHEPSLAEQGLMLARTLKNMGLCTNFAPLIILVGHGSSTTNPAYSAALACAFCHGNSSLNNARLFAELANQTAVRTQLIAQGIVIPEDCWFIALEHNTRTETLTWHDTAALPKRLNALFAALQKAVNEAAALTALEHYRNNATPPVLLTPAQAQRVHTVQTSELSNVSADFAHAGHAALYLGRRASTQALNLSGRVYLQSYDPIQDASGDTLATLLLSTVRLHSQINLAYYFSTLTNLAVDTSAALEDALTTPPTLLNRLPTVLPKHLTEHHEAMRLHIIIEQHPEVFFAIYQRQALLQPLINGQWVHISCQDPNTRALFTFNPATGFNAWLPT
jgi:uncharacterized protein YbcC (UPF0753/DUF2309 family)